MRPAVLYIPQATPYSEQTGDIITFKLFEQGGILQKELNLVVDKSILVSIYDLYAYDNSDGESISMDALEEIQGGNYVHPNINERDTRLSIRDRIRKSQSEWEGEELSAKRMGKG